MINIGLKHVHIYLGAICPLARQRRQVYIVDRYLYNVVFVRLVRLVQYPSILVLDASH